MHTGVLQTSTVQGSARSPNRFASLFPAALCRRQSTVRWKSLVLRSRCRGLMRRSCTSSRDQKKSPHPPKQVGALSPSPSRPLLLLARSLAKGWQGFFVVKSSAARVAIPRRNARAVSLLSDAATIQRRASVTFLEVNKSRIGGNVATSLKVRPRLRPSSRSRHLRHSST